MKIQTLRCEYASPPNPSGDLVVVLHGRGDSSKGFHWMPQALSLPGVSYLLVNAPDDWYGGFSWYDLPPEHGAGVLRSRGLLDALFEELQAQGVAPERTVLFGFSQGCLLTFEWGARSELPLAGCVGVSGYCYDAEALSGELSQAALTRPWLITHGTQDPVLAFQTTADQVKVLQSAGLPLDFRSYSKTHTIDADLADIRAAMMKMLGLTD